MFWKKFKIKGKILSALLLLSVLTLGITGTLMLINMDWLGNYALEKMTSLGATAVVNSKKNDQNNQNMFDIDKNFTIIYLNVQGAAIMRPSIVNPVLSLCDLVGNDYMKAVCRARAFAEKGDFLAADPDCIYIPGSKK